MSKPAAPAPGPTTPCCAVEATMVAGAVEKRAPFRAEHLDRVRRLMADGTLLVAGAYDDLGAALLVFDLADETPVAALIEDDVYFKQGIWTAYKVRKLNRVVGP